MGLESATYISDFDASNPLAGDRKNQGDDHLRLIKTVLRTTLPNADRPFRFPEVLSKNGNYTVLEVDDNKTILCDTTVSFTLTLPTGLTTDGWLVRVMKPTADVNPVFVAPPSGTINGLAKMRCNVPFVEYVFMWTGSGFVRSRAAGEAQPGTFEPYAGAAAPVGFAFPIGQSLIRADHPELFAAWGTTWGAADGTHFTVPDLRDRFLVGAGSSYGLGAVGGEAAHTLTLSESPAHAHGLIQSNHDHGIAGGTTGADQIGADTIGGTSPRGIGAALDVTPAGITISMDSQGGGGAHENRPPYLALNSIFRLC